MKKLFYTTFRFVTLSIVSSTYANAQSSNAPSTLIIEPAPFNVRVYVCGKYVGEVYDQRKTFYVHGVWGPSLITLESEKFHTFGSEARHLYPGDVFKISEVHYLADESGEASWDKEIRFTAKWVKASGYDFNGSEPTVKSFKQRYPNTYSFWKEVVRQSSRYKNQMKALGYLAYPDAARIHGDFVASMHHIDPTGVDPQLLYYFRRTIDAYADYAACVDGIPSGWLKFSVKALISAVKAKANNDATELLDVVGDFKQVESASDIYLLSEMAMWSEFDRLDATLLTMDWEFIRDGSNRWFENAGFDLPVYEHEPIFSASMRFRSWLGSN